MDDNGFRETQESRFKELEKENAVLKELLSDSIGNWDKLKKAYDELKESHEYCHLHGGNL